MKNRKTVLLIVALGVAIFPLSLFLLKQPHAGNYLSKGVHSPLFWEESMFYDVVLKISNRQRSDHLVKGGVIPHHLLASGIIADFFQYIGDQSIKRIILIGPNHYELGKASVITSFYDWGTPVGTVSADIPFTETLLSQAWYLKADEEVAEKEHSVSGIMPFIAHYFPQAKVVSLIVSMDTVPSIINDLALRLKTLADNQTLFIAAVDFSHYLSRDQASERDATTLALLEDNNLENFITLNSQYTDSPNSIALLFRIMNNIGLSNFHILNHTNSSAITDNKFGEVTSYFTLVFQEE